MLQEEKKEDKLPPAGSSKAKARQSKVGESSKGSKENKNPVVKEEDTEEYEDEEEGEFFDPGPPPITEKDLMTMTDLLYDM